MISDCPFKVASSGVSWWSPVLRRGARKQSTQFNNHPGCLNRTREARLSVYFPCIALRLPFNFMAKWTSLTSCAPSPSIPTSHPDSTLHPHPSSPPCVPEPPSSSSSLSLISHGTTACVVNTVGTQANHPSSHFYFLTRGFRVAVKIWTNSCLELLENKQKFKKKTLPIITQIITTQFW